VTPAAVLCPRKLSIRPDRSCVLPCLFFLLADNMSISDQTEGDVINLRRQIYLTIMSSADFEECAHKLLKIQFKPGQEVLARWLFVFS
jgi:hypothetical protein